MKTLSFFSLFYMCNFLTPSVVGNNRSPNNSPTTQPNTYRKQLYNVGVQGAGLQKGQPLAGVENGPAFIRESGFINFLRQEGHIVFDYGDIDFGFESPNPATGNRTTTEVVNVAEVSNATFLISEQTTRILREGRFPLTLGGDHSLTVGTIHGVSEVYPDLAVLWIDAHSDINTPATTPSGNLHGMPLSLLLQELSSNVTMNLTEFSWITPRLSARNLAYIGLRYSSIGEGGEKGLRRQLGISDWNMRDIDRLGIIEVTKRALNNVRRGRRNRPIYISFDIDVLDDNEIGGATGTPVAGGLLLREAMTMLDLLQETANIVGMELTEVNPALGDEKAQRRISIASRSLISCIFGLCRKGFN